MVGRSGVSPGHPFPRRRDAAVHVAAWRATYRGVTSDAYLDGLSGRGLGRALISAAMDALRNRENLGATLWVVAGDERALRTYTRLGWPPDGTEKIDTTRGAKVTEIRMRVDLRPRGPSLVEHDGWSAIDVDGSVDDDLMYRLRDEDRQRGAPRSPDI